MIVSLLFALQVAPLPLERADRLLEPSRLILKTLDVDLAFGFPEAPSGWRFSEKESLESGTWFVQARPGDYVDLRSQVRREGGATFDYLPNNGFEARIPAGALPSIRSRAAAVVPIHPWWKLDPEIGKSRTSAEDEDGRVLLAVEFWGDQDLDFCRPKIEFV